MECSDCGGGLDRQILKGMRVQSKCKACHAAYMRRWRAERGGHAGLSSEQRRRSNARAYANVYLSRGKIQREGCLRCGGEAEMHHEDYSKPLEVTWLCREHHLERHDEMMRGDTDS